MMIHSWLVERVRVCTVISLWGGNAAVLTWVVVFDEGSFITDKMKVKSCIYAVHWR